MTEPLNIEPFRDFAKQYQRLTQRALGLYEQEVDAILHGHCTDPKRIERQLDGTKQQAFLNFVLAQYVKVGVRELDREKLAPLLKLKYSNAIADAVADLGKPEEIGKAFSDFQKYLYLVAV